MLRPVFGSALAFAAAILFSTIPASAQIKAGVINLQKAVLETSEIKKAQKDLEAKYKSRTDALDKTQRELNDIQAELQASQGKISAAREVELQAQGNKKQRDAQRLSEDLQADVERDRNDVLQRVGTRMTEVVRKIAEEKGLDMVVDVTNAIYFKPALEVTTDAIAAYDKAYPVK
jgi:outer membrane protein